MTCENNVLIETIKEENKKLIEAITDEYAKQLEKAELEKANAEGALILYTTAIKGLEMNYRKRIQRQIDRIVETQKKEPAKKQIKK